MEDINIDNGNERILRIPALEIIGKLRTKEDRQNFCRENKKPICIIFRLICSDERAWCKADVFIKRFSFNGKKQY